MLWIFFTLLAALSQTVRNALQSKLSSSVSTLGVTLARFIFATPIAIAYLCSLYFFDPQSHPKFTTQFVLFCAFAAFMQIVATALMVQLFKQQNFAIGAGLAKSEALIAALLGALFFGSQLTILGWFGVLVGTLAIFLLSGITNSKQFKIKTVVIGLLCGASFALTSLFIREASLVLSVPFPHSAAWVLVFVLCMQTIVLSIYIYLKQPNTFTQLKNNLGTTFSVSLTSCIGSIGWFSAMSLQYVAYVKTLGQIEVLFTILISLIWLKQKVAKNELLGLLLIAIAAIMVMWQN